MKTAGGEVIETELETISEDTGFTGDRIQALLDLANKTEEVGKALDKIRKFVLARSLPGDWVKFGEAGKSGSLCLTGGGAERIANALGISFTDFSEPKKEVGEDRNGAFYTYYYLCTVRLGGRKIESVEGRASSRDRFFGYAHGAWKDLADVKEADIRTAARRSAMKEGVKLILGLRNIPESSAQELGLDVGKIKSVNFDGSGGTTVTEPTGPADAGKGAVQIKELKFKRKGGTKAKPWEIYTAFFSDGRSVDYFKSDRGAEPASTLEKALKEKLWLNIVLVKEGQYFNLAKYEVVPEPKPEEKHDPEKDGDGPPPDREPTQEELPS